MKKYKQLTREQRYQIYALRKEGLSMGSIAINLEVAKSTISREIKRNTGGKGYRAKQAHEKALLRHAQKPKVIRLTKEIKTLIKEQLRGVESSPEQISGRLKVEYQLSISHETIYQYLITDRTNGGDLYLHLRHKHKKYRKRYGSTDRRGQIIGRVSIDNRPVIVEEKSRIGDFEGDLVIGHNHKGALATLVDRHSKFALIAKVPNKSANNVAEAIIAMLHPIKEHLRTITFDNGKEFAYHQTISDVLAANVYFAHPYHSWERGLNEHTNGLIRQYFPKGSSLEDITVEQIMAVQNKLNHRPRKVLGFKTPHEVFYGKILEAS
jgi:IS30 family transposase